MCIPVEEHDEYKNSDHGKVISYPYHVLSSFLAYTTCCAVRFAQMALGLIRHEQVMREQSKISAVH